MRASLLSYVLTFAIGASALVPVAARAQAADVTAPTVITHVDATYPSAALAAKKHADVVLTLTVDARGAVSNVEIAESGGADFDEAAAAAAKQWTFVPAKRKGEPVASKIRVPFHFAPPPEPKVEASPPRVDDAGVMTRVEDDALRVMPPTEVRVSGRAPSRGASDFRIAKKTLTAAPHGSGADLLATAPGVYVAHPEGEAIAQRIYLRGFDAEHGQDVELRVAGIPMNQPSHIHGQGYADLNLVIPEAVRSIRVIEGVYDPHQADFAVAGSAEYDLGVEERRSRVKVSYGSFDTKRLVAIWAPQGQAEETFGAATLRTTDGFGDGTRGATSGGVLGQYRLALPYDVTALVHVGAYAARANLAGVLRRDDYESARVGFYDAYPDPSARSQSAGTSRAQLGITVERSRDDGAKTTAGMWLYLASFRSRTNFTGYLERGRVDPTRVGLGDLVEQSNGDFGLGGVVSYRSARLRPHENLGVQYELGADMRTHRISQTQNLLKAPQNETWDQRDDAEIKSTDVGLYGDALFSVSRFVRLRGGARADLLFFDVDDKLGNFIPAAQKKTHFPGFRRTASGIAFGPRATLEGHPTRWLKLSASYGQGYRSPQARQLEEGEQAPFAKVHSYELGATVRDGEDFAVTGVAYQTNLSTDLVFDPGEARLERIGPTTRRGLVGTFLANPSDHLHVAVSATYVHATLDSPPLATPENPTPPYVEGQALPYVPPVLVRSDVAYTRNFGSLLGKPLTWKVGYGTTFLSSRPLPYSQYSPPVFLLDTTLGVRRDFIELTLDAFNLLDARFAEIEYAFVSNWQSSAIPSRVPARHITAGAPRAILASLTLYL
ncbi:MAG: TonB family protein [Labilithrix sp.]|nr:TonB family protein [Labilithrix sp.]